ncbi:hypothetical protein SAMN06265348_101232 [Pedobacter westerhofensis]|uniref:Uncharacterized protein n=1 Tax=Pedobacter westerhofensis TaxID=425512 RepID=A0A521AIP5_9SPHI|nr:hypothetical protein [Pedobacter westerhofensis]SMO34653.1 hypothetical protein SAMN06265348_101232 [Pedobacter westerhofensis]
MAVTKFAKEDIIPIVIHILSFSTVKFAEYGYKSVLEKDMPELLALDEDDVDVSMYFQVLLASDDDISVAINKCIALIDATIDTFRIMFAIDLEELYTDDRIHEMANQIYADLYYYADGLVDDSISTAVMELPFTAANAFFFLCRLIIHHEIDAELSMDDGFYGTGWEEFEFMDTSDNNVAVVYDLIQEILKMNIEISNIYAGRGF